MGESICFVRSFSQPASLEINEVVPHRVLSESVSFGRYASESLQWEKWSAFTQNRYLEEVERFTKPGSVAEKKAFFEAHFKNRAAGRTTQTKIKDNLIDSEVVNNGLAINEVRHEEVDNAEIDHVATVENLTSMNVLEEEALDEENSTSLSKERRSSSSGSKTSKLEPLDLSLRKTRNQPSSSSKRSLSVSKSRNRSSLNPIPMSISSAPPSNTDKNIVKIAKKASRSTTSTKGAGKSGPISVHTTKGSPKNLARNSTIQETTPNTRSSVFPNENEPKSRKRPLPLTTKEGSNGAKCSTSGFPNENKPTEASKSRKRPLPLTSKEGSNAAKCSTSASTVRLPELFPPNNRLSEHKRKNITKESSVTCRIPKNVQRQPSVSESLSNQTRIRAKSCTVSSPFNFRSDERAEKRKEFFKKLEEKNKKEVVLKEQSSCGFKESLISLNSPRFCKNQTPGKENIKKSHQPPNKVASMEKNKRCKIHPSSRTQTNKKTQENSSPNILQN